MNGDQGQGTAMQALIDRLARIEAQAGTEQRVWLEERLAGIEKQLGRFGREQLKATSLAEAQSVHLAAVVEALERVTTTESALPLPEVERRIMEAEVALAMRLFPTLDGLIQAQRAGKDLLARPRRQSWWERLGGDQGEGADREALASWLAGLGLIEERLLALLAGYGISPIAAAGQPFDPHLHTAVEVTATNETPPGMIIEELRRGYVRHEVVIRASEVRVSRAENTTGA